MCVHDEDEIRILTNCFNKIEEMSSFVSKLMSTKHWHNHITGGVCVCVWCKQLYANTLIVYWNWRNKNTKTLSMMVLVLSRCVCVFCVCYREFMINNLYFAVHKTFACSPICSYGKEREKCVTRGGRNWFDVIVALDR